MTEAAEDRRWFNASNDDALLVWVVILNNFVILGGVCSFSSVLQLPGLRLCDYLLRRNLNGETFFIILEVFLRIMLRLTFRIIEVYIITSLSLGACVCLSFSNLKTFLDLCSKTNHSSVSLFSDVCQKSVSVLDSHHFIWTSVYK